MNEVVYKVKIAGVSVCRKNTMADVLSIGPILASDGYNHHTITDMVAVDSFSLVGWDLIQVPGRSSAIAFNLKDGVFNYRLYEYYYEGEGVVSLQPVETLFDGAVLLDYRTVSKIMAIVFGRSVNTLSYSTVDTVGFYQMYLDKENKVFVYPVRIKNNGEVSCRYFWKYDKKKVTDLDNNDKSFAVTLNDFESKYQLVL